MKKRKRKVKVITVEYVDKNNNEWVKREFIARNDKEFYDWIHEQAGGAGHWLIHSVRTAYI